MQYPLGIQAIVAACRWNRNWLNEQLAQLPIRANVGGPLEEATTPARVAALAAIIRRVPVPTLATDAESYAGAVLSMLDSPEASLYGEPEIEAIINELASIAKDHLYGLQVALLTIAEDNTPISLQSLRSVGGSAE